MAKPFDERSGLLESVRAARKVEAFEWKRMGAKEVLRGASQH